MSADTAVLPPWKLALLNKKKQKEADEQRKRDEEQAYLESLPPWKRAIVLKHRAASGRPTSPDSAKERPCSPEGQRQTSTEHSGKVTSMAKSFLGGGMQHAPRPAPEARPAPTSSTVKARRASFELDTIEFPLHSGPAASSTASNKVTTARKMSLPDKVTSAAPVANGGPQHAPPPPPEMRPTPTTSTAKAKWGSCESDTIEAVPRHNGPAHSTAKSNKTETPPWPNSFDTDSTGKPMANGGPQHSPTALEPQQRPRSKSDSTARTASYSSASSRVVKAEAPLVAQPRPRVNTQPARPVVRTNSSEASTGGEKDSNKDNALDHLPPWKRELILRKRVKSQQGVSPPSTAGQEAADGAVGSKHSSAASSSSTVRKPQPSANMFKLMPRVVSPTPPEESEPTTLKQMTPPKQSVTVEQSATTNQPMTVKQSVKVKCTAAKLSDTPKPSMTNSHPTIASRPAPVRPGATTEERKPAPKIAYDKKGLEPPVNSAKSREAALSPEQNPKELIPPVFPEVEPWSRVSEEDPEFKALPPWKQALILRRRRDIQLRSCAPEYLRRHVEQQETAKVDKAERPEVDTVWSPSHIRDMPNLRHVSAPAPRTEEEEEAKVPPWKLDFIRNRRLKEQLRAEKEDNPAHHQIHVASSEDEDDVFTHIDDLESDEDYLILREVDEVGELRGSHAQSASSSSSSLSSASTQQSILLSAEKKRSNSVSLLHMHALVFQCKDV